jgi:bis(5'-nucleosyl)-tetraphosphatase (symmetrical)
MALYLIGDVQGCDAALQRLLDTLAFSPSQDTLFFLGDLVNRGPESVQVLRRLLAYGSSAQCVLGNHDLHLLALACGARTPSAKDTVADVLQAPDRDALLHWLAQQPLARQLWVADQEDLLVHAGVLPQWSAADTIELAHEVSVELRQASGQPAGGAAARAFFQAMYGNTPNHWSADWQGAERTRVVVNALTRLRFCTAQGEMEFDHSGAADSAPAGYLPWFDVPGRNTSDITVAFGHWSRLGALARSDVLALDTGCVWGGCLSALRLAPGATGQGLNTERIAVACEPAQSPGD